MPEYRCQYVNGGRLGIGEEWYKNIIAENQYEACKKFIKDVGFHENPVMVEGGGFMSSPKHFDESAIKRIWITIQHQSKNKETLYQKNVRKKLEERKQSAKNFNILLIKNKNSGYFKLNPIEKIKFQNLFKQIINYSLNEVLLDEEIEFLHLWNNFKDRHFGQTLIAQNEAQKPPSERGQSELASTIVSGIAVGNLIKANQLNEMREMNETMDEMAEDVEDVNEGFGFDE